MEFALNKEGNRIHPRPERKGLCPLCESSVHARCGKYKVWHFAHDNLEECDAWTEPETEWHRLWKKRVPEDNREVVIEKNGQKHRADILLDNGRVIEVQNSGISFEELRSRENFYDNMIWIVNGTENPERFDIRNKREEIEVSEEIEQRLYVCNQCEEEAWFSSMDIKRCSACEDVFACMIRTDDERTITKKFKREEGKIKYQTFRWKYAKKVYADSTVRCYIDLGMDNGVFEIKKIHSKKGKPTGGWGYLLSYDVFCKRYGLEKGIMTLN